MEMQNDRNLAENNVRPSFEMTGDHSKEKDEELFVRVLEIEKEASQHSLHGN